MVRVSFREFRLVSVGSVAGSLYAAGVTNEVRDRLDRPFRIPVPQAAARLSMCEAILRAGLPAFIQTKV
jgi:hypothetical protein